MSIFRESGITVTLTNLDHHRFCDLPTYRAISGQHVREVDYCWLQHKATGSIQADTLVGLELKNYEKTDIPVDTFFNDLIKKIRDTLSLFSAAWLQQGLGAQLQNELPQSYRTFSPQRKIILVMLVNITSNQTIALKSVREKLKAQIKGIERLHGITVTVCNLAAAQKMGLPVTPIIQSTL